ncbi:low molecular weight protein-tyrosine-phosphatase [Shewanella sp. Arc9-LZ]|uniref:low molecular weight protein-tyrosine-phosphatase n=1 Tax=Shewanella sp. Arc9-LZ TaxID=2698686 RepID=UPI00137BB870|nr:low molecular weight protein-tyrosine-phosphatase [Shewanella sp. Arc9-LZ]QHS13963.1 low molecular weight phosphotyrosine protein phosphatase [Shewanella sp. Arc9-LZ]
MIDDKYLLNVRSVLFVCMGNICRSPTAEAVFRQQMKRHSLQLDIDSAGTIAYHQGHAPDSRSIIAGNKHGLDFSGMKARQVIDADFERFDLILAADFANLNDLKDRCPAHLRYKLQLILSYGDSLVEEVPDPYYGGERGFEMVIDLLEASLMALAIKLAKR